MSSRPRSTLSQLARLGFSELSRARDSIDALDATPGAGGITEHLEAFGVAADPDRALRALQALLDRHPDALAPALEDSAWMHRLVRVLGASEGLGQFLLRQPSELRELATPLDEPLSAEQYRADLAATVDGLDAESGQLALRVRYRRHLLRLAAWDLEHPDPRAAMPEVGAALADLAGAALEAGLALARATSPFPAAEVAATRLAIIGMGKCGARELNYLSDVDVIYAVDAGDGVEVGRAVEIGTRLATVTARSIQEPGIEPPLWEVDANLRPEGKDGALVRSLDSHRAYYERWAKNWEFQALLKARPIAGDRDVGERFLAITQPLVWDSSQREGFVEQVQGMRERVTAHIPAHEVDVQVKLGPGGLRDIEFTVQLLQLVHGAHDDRVRQRDTLGALASLAEHGYIGRAEAAEFSGDYRLLRVIEHRLQLDRLTRTHLMPRDPERQRSIARATALATTADELVALWQTTKLAVRSLHEKLFYRPLLSAVAQLPDEQLALTSDQAEARLAAIGFADPTRALQHIAALTSGVSRRAAIQRTLVPVILQWLADGADPDHGLLAFRRLSDDLGETYWFLRMLRDSSGAAQRLSSVLAASRFVGGLFERTPEGAAWLEDDAELQPRPRETLLDEVRAILSRHANDDDAATKALRVARRRETLRIALAAMVDVINVEQLGGALSDVTTAYLQGALGIAHRQGDGIEFGIIAMGRYGGGELGFGSDADVIYVFRDAGAGDDATTVAQRVVTRLIAVTEDIRLPFELDAGLRPEGRNGPIVRSLTSYRAYYERWSLTWEAQALLRACPAAGDESLLADFMALADEVRYPAEFGETEAREVRRIKARVESERLPQAADPARHLKLGRGSLSDVEWFVQLLQLQHAARVPALRTPSTLRALAAAADAELITPRAAERLRAAWLIASRVRSAAMLWTGKTADVLPLDRTQLDAIARLLAYPPKSAAQLEEDYLRTTRLARRVFEKGFYGN
ncbi:MAG TPA: bifunctional [glutamine synthetase] adenylyltransferase/[glutamine synthetase]-adenylyl-L-tyrosine phosphorylase [Microcella sp.]|nr:bifunctional [glutamine synthetase] adenylyltransferase/[glutamine synthetase]-adenylyl-L-tyrosine phosphorylase [Microcella sp.]